MDILSEFASRLNINLTIIIVFISAITAGAIIHIAGSYLGSPFGELILRFMPDHQFTDEDSEDELARKLGSGLGVIPWSVALVLELVAETERAEINGWSLWCAERALFRACVDGLLILAILWGIGRTVSIVLL